MTTAAKERNLYFTDVYKESMTSYPLYTATKEQYEDKDWNPEHTIGLGDTSDILIPFTKPTVGTTKQLSSALYSGSRNAIKAPFVEMQARINEKLLANTPKGGTLGSDGILRHNDKEYVARSMDITGNKVIYEQIMNSKGTGNFKMMQGGRFVSTGKPVQVTEGINYKFGNFIYNPKTWVYGVVLEEMVNGYLSPEPPMNGLQAIGGGINKLIEMRNE